MAEWPGGARGALCLSFDNLGEAAAIELGALAPDDPSIGDHPTATQVLPSLLEALNERDLAATFFVEGLNAELYPDALKAIAAAGHEVAYHAWRHEQWGELSAAEQTENLARGISAFEAIGLEIAGFRPPGGQLGPGGTEVLRDAGLRYCSPAGEGTGVVDGIALLPFQWRHVDATSVLPGLEPVREEIAGLPGPIDPGAFVAHLGAEIDPLVTRGGCLTIVLHLALLDWIGAARLAALLDHAARAARGGDLWTGRCADAAEHLLAHPEARANGGSRLDSTRWTSGA